MAPHGSLCQICGEKHQYLIVPLDNRPNWLVQREVRRNNFLFKKAKKDEMIMLDRQYRESSRIWWNLNWEEEKEQAKQRRKQEKERREYEVQKALVEAAENCIKNYKLELFRMDQDAGYDADWEMSMLDIQKLYAAREISEARSARRNRRLKKFEK